MFNSGFNCIWMDRWLFADSFLPQLALYDTQLFCLWAFQSMEARPSLGSGTVLFQDNHYEWVERWVDRHSSLSSCIGEFWATCHLVSQRVSRGLEPQLFSVINQFNNSPFIGVFPSLLHSPMPLLLESSSKETTWTQGLLPGSLGGWTQTKPICQIVSVRYTFIG